MVNKSDWQYIRKNLIWAAIVNFSIAMAIFIQMYFQQQQIIERLDQLESTQQALYQEVLEIYKNK
jgi:hypothetical protein